MSENGINGSLQPSEHLRESSMPGVKSMPQHIYNGLASSQNSSRGSSPSPHMPNIPASQLPPSRAIPASQLPPAPSVNLVTQKVSQLSVQNQLLSNVNKPQFTSTPTEPPNLQKKPIELGSGDFSPITSKIDNKTSLVQQNFQDVPLNEHVPTSNQTSRNEPLNSHTKTSEPLENATQFQKLPLTSNSNLFDSKGLQSHQANFNNRLNLNIQPINATSSQPMAMHHVSQNQQSSIQPLARHNSASHLFQNSQNPISQPVSQPSPTITRPAQPLPSRSQNLHSDPRIPSQNYYPNFPVQNQSPISHNFPVQKQPLMPTGSNLNPPRVTRPNFNFNAMGAQPQSQISPMYAGSAKMPQMPGTLNLNAPNSQLQSRPPPAMQPPPLQTSPNHQRAATLHTNRYPAIPAQRVSSQPNLPSSYNHHYETQPVQNMNQSMPIQNQQFQTQHHNQQYQNRTAAYNQSNQYQNQHPSVVNQGFSKLWGAENCDLLQIPNILPPTKISPPRIILGNEMHNSANCSGEIFRCTVTKIPESQSLLQKSRLPLGILIHPFKDLDQLSVIQCNTIVRCRACRTYINPYVFFVDSKRWKCNLCYRVNDLPEEFHFDPVSKTYGEPTRRPEIRSSTIEYIAPAEYMLRPPQPAVYLYLLDVSRLAIESGYLNVFCKVVKEELENIPGDARTQVGFITYDSCLHFFSLAEGLSQPHEMMVLDIEDVFLPCPDNLLVNLKDRKDLIKDLLNELPTRYINSYDNNSALGAALQAAHRMMSATGGRVTVFQASLPNVGPGGLTSREDPNQRAAAEVHNLKPAHDFYKRLALDCSSQQIAVDLFVVNSQYVDIATISGISRFSGGCIHHFPLFKYGRPILTEKLERSFRRYITRKIGFEAVMRIRCTRGMSIHTFHGNFFVRSTDLLSLPNVNPDAGYGMQVSIDESLNDVETVCFQAALLYTSSKGERRIRVHTLCLPVVSNLHDVINSADQQCIVGLLAKMAVDRSIESSLSDAREAFINVAIDILSSYKFASNMASSMSGLHAPECLKLLPLYISALLKNQAFRTGTSTRLDDRVKAMIDMKTMPLQWLMQNIYPDLYPVHNLEEHPVVLNVDEQPVHIPPHLQLTSRLIDNYGAYLMDIGDHMMLYVCSGVSQVFLNEGLGVSNCNSLSDQIYEIPILENLTNQRLVTFINYLNNDKPFGATFQVIKDNSPNRGLFLERLIEDRVENALSYHEFLQHVKAQVK